MELKLVPRRRLMLTVYIDAPEDPNERDKVKANVEKCLKQSFSNPVCLDACIADPAGPR